MSLHALKQSLLRSEYQSVCLGLYMLLVRIGIQKGVGLGGVAELDLGQPATLKGLRIDLQGQQQRVTGIKDKGKDGLRCA